VSYNLSAKARLM